MEKTRILILGGGFGGIYAALELERRRDADLEVTLVSEENFFLFTPMLHEVTASDLDLTAIVSPIRRLLRHVRFFSGSVTRIDLAARQIEVVHGFDRHAHVLEYDHIVFGLGSVTNFFNIPGLAGRALTMKSLADAAQLRNRLIAHLEEADSECAARDRDPLVTFVVAGGGFAGVETIGSIHDFLHSALRHYPNLRKENIRVVLVHPGDYVLPELGESLGRYTGGQLERRGIEVRVNTKVEAVTPREVVLSDGTRIPCFTLVWTAGTATHPLLGTLDLPKERGRLKVDATMRVEGCDGIWALGDCAMIPDINQPGSFHPPTAQHASREGKVLAGNVARAARRESLVPFRFKTLGLLASIGHRTGVARILGMNFSGFVAWWLWRGIYLSKLPRTEKKLRVALEWLLDMFFAKDFVQYQRDARQAATDGAGLQTPTPVRAACDIQTETMGPAREAGVVSVR